MKIITNGWKLSREKNLPHLNIPNFIIKSCRRAKKREFTWEYQFLQKANGSLTAKPFNDVARSFLRVVLMVKVLLVTNWCREWTNV